ncbi:MULTISPECIES: Uma2 family endonuclease [unclassified Streptomyces]|uniref:Uma2 family endonuclease n=1 Tax=unclassified Streptomyces TaxID=2593676 RepID=UPI0035E37B8C
MSALAVEAGQGWDDVVRLWHEMEWPEGCKVEIIEGIITVAPSPANQHNSIAERIQRRLYTVVPEDWGIYQTQAVAVPARSGMFIPDLLVAPEAALREPGHYIPATTAELVVEITSQSNANHDRIAKAAGYAMAGVPLYLLVDRWAPGGPTVTLYGQPKGGVYRVLSAVPFGEEIHLPAPFGLTLDTADFPVS